MWARWLICGLCESSIMSVQEICSVNKVSPKNCISHAAATVSDSSCSSCELYRGLGNPGCHCSSGMKHLKHLLHLDCLKNFPHKSSCGIQVRAEVQMSSWFTCCYLRPGLFTSAYGLDSSMWSVCKTWQWNHYIKSVSPPPPDLLCSPWQPFYSCRMYASMKS